MRASSARAACSSSISRWRIFGLVELQLHAHRGLGLGQQELDVDADAHAGEDLRQDRDNRKDDELLHAGREGLDDDGDGGAHADERGDLVEEAGAEGVHLDDEGGAQHPQHGRRAALDDAVEDIARRQARDRVRRDVEHPHERDGVVGCVQIGRNALLLRHLVTFKRYCSCQ